MTEQQKLQITKLRNQQEMITKTIHCLDDEIIRLRNVITALNRHVYKFHCDHLQPDGRTAMEGGFMCSMCSICGYCDL